MSADFWAGYISGAAGIIIGNPLDLIKVRLQAGTPINASTFSSYGSQFESTSALIRGATAPILGYGALNALLFVTYNRTAALLNESSTIHPRIWTTWVAGAAGGLATWAVSTPTELVKCRAQMSTTPISSLSIIREIFRTEGLKGLYFGGTVTALRDSIGYGFYFWSYDLGTRLLASKSGDTTTPSSEAAKVLLCGGMAGIVTWASIFPLDVIKTRVQTQLFHDEQTTSLLQQNRAATVLRNGRLGAMEIARRAYREEGLAVFFRGLTVCSVRAFIVNAAQWAIYEWIMKELQPTKKI